MQFAMSHRLFFMIFLLFQLLPGKPEAQVVEHWKKAIKFSLNHANKAIAMEMDKFGNCYITGITWMPDSTKDILIMKFSAEGDEIWRRIYDGPAHGDDIPVAMCLDHYGDVIVAGTSKDQKGNGDMCLLKFSNEGVPVFSKVFGGDDGLFDSPAALTCDPLGNIIVGGHVSTKDSDLEYAIYRFFPNGNPHWSKSGGTKNMDVCNVLITDDSCNVYMAGSYDVSMRSSDMILQKYDSSGTRIWEYIYDGMLSMRDAAFHLASDDSMNLYVSGFINHGSDRSDLPLLKYSRNGELLLQNVHFGGMKDCNANELFVDESGAYLTASQNDYMSGRKASMAIHFNKAGEQKLLIRNEKGLAFGKMVNLSGSPLILGNGLMEDGNTRIPYVAEPDTTGEPIWEYADSSVAGVLYFADYRVRGAKLYFLGDDTGEANGTIYLFCYRLLPGSTNKSGSALPKSSKGAIRKN